MILEINHLFTSYGFCQVLFDVSLHIDEGEIVSILGRNGMGKTTTLRSIMGLTPPQSGSIKWMGKEILGKPAHLIAKMGIGFVPEDRRIFADLTVWENLDVAVKASKRQRGSWMVEKVFDFFPALKPIQNRKGGYLSGGEQQMLTIARTLMGNPSLLLLDEPSEGLAPLIVKQLGEQITNLRRDGITILMCEQNTLFSVSLSDRVYILEKGRVCYQGSVDEFRENDEVCQAYITLG